jgi:lysophospholipase L1-like esterase
MALACALAACASAGASNHATAALGDSLTQAFFSNGVQPPADVPANSWSTGTSTSVNSHYTRLLALNPAISGNARNYAQSGSLMSATHAQAGQAVSQGAGYVTVLSGTNDVCEDKVADMTSVADFTAQFRSTLTRLTSGLPNAKIFVTSIPDWYGHYQRFKNDQAALDAWATYYTQFGGLCRTIFGASTSSADRETARQRLSDYNSALAAVCTEFAACTYDGGAVFSLQFVTADLAPDYFHFSVQGEAKVAATTWGVSPARPPGAAVVGTPWADLLLGRAGNDVIRGLAGRDRLFGRGGNDALRGGPGRDRLIGGPGNDVLWSRDGRRDFVLCGTGRDRVLADRLDRLSESCESVRRA